MGKSVIEIDPKAMEVLINYQWFGNVRELENVIERAMILTDTDHIKLENIPIHIQNFKGEIQWGPLGEEEYSIKKTSKFLETDLIKRALKKTNGNHAHAAKLLEISHRALLYKIKEYEIVENDL
jgi:two-component system response regulator AtoC